VQMQMARAMQLLRGPQKQAELSRAMANRGGETHSSEAPPFVRFGVIAVQLERGASSRVDPLLRTTSQVEWGAFAHESSMATVHHYALCNACFHQPVPGWGACPRIQGVEVEFHASSSAPP
jgi:hypothetical protein